MILNRSRNSKLLFGPLKAKKSELLVWSCKISRFNISFVTKSIFKRSFLDFEIRRPKEGEGNILWSWLRFLLGAFERTKENETGFASYTFGRHSCFFLSLFWGEDGEYTWPKPKKRTRTDADGDTFSSYWTWEEDWKRPPLHSLYYRRWCRDKKLSLNCVNFCLDDNFLSAWKKKRN